MGEFLHRVRDRGFEHAGFLERRYRIVEALLLFIYPAQIQITSPKARVEFQALVQFGGGLVVPAGKVEVPAQQGVDFDGKRVQVLSAPQFSNPLVESTLRWEEPAIPFVGERVVWFKLHSAFEFTFC